MLNLANSLPAIVVKSSRFSSPTTIRSKRKTRRYSSSGAGLNAVWHDLRHILFSVWMASFVAVAGGASALADSPHTTLFQCYAYVHDQCHGPNNDNCGDDPDDGYQETLDMCDDEYQGQSAKRPAAPKGIKIGKKNPEVLQRIRNSFGKN